MTSVEQQPDGNRDFDFLVGTWSVTNQRLPKALEGRTDWEEFPGEVTCRPIFDGAGNVDEIVFPTKGFSGLTLRLFDRERQEWSLYWVNCRSTTIDAPVIGRFVNGVGEFLCDDIYEGVPIRCRYTWSRITPTSAHWEQAFSTDGEQTWETNWFNDLTRIEPNREWEAGFARLSLEREPNVDGVS